MLRNSFLYIIFLFSFLLSQNDSLNYHISLSLHENLINDFFIGMGEISGKGETPLGSYKWVLLNPKIDIEEDTILFISKVKLSFGDMKTHKDVKGWVSATFNKETNKVELKIEEAKVILDLDIFGKNIVLTELDIAHYFSKPFNLNGPQAMNEHVEFNLPNGDIRQIKVSNRESYMYLKKDAIIVKTLLDFSE
tara:strand:+ start:2942 stop:3520 length:579 start_codon:yes stop_codon:yes gene_type:complete